MRVHLIIFRFVLVVHEMEINQNLLIAMPFRDNRAASYTVGYDKIGFTQVRLALSAVLFGIDESNPAQAPRLRKSTEKMVPTLSDHPDHAWFIDRGAAGVGQSGLRH